MRLGVGQGHEVCDMGNMGLREEFGDEDVAAVRLFGSCIVRGGDHKVTALVFVKETDENGGRIKVWPAEVVD